MWHDLNGDSYAFVNFRLSGKVFLLSDADQSSEFWRVRTKEGCLRLSRSKIPFKYFPIRCSTEFAKLFLPAAKRHGHAELQVKNNDDKSLLTFAVLVIVTSVLGVLGISLVSLSLFFNFSKKFKKNIKISKMFKFLKN